MNAPACPFVSSTRTAVAQPCKSAAAGFAVFVYRAAVVWWCFVVDGQAV